MNTDLRLFIYEQYGNGQIDRETARALISRISGPEYYERAYLNAMAEIDAAESAFMESALDYANGYADQFTFEAQAETLSQKIGNAWKTFKKWVSEMWDKLLKFLGIRKTEDDKIGMEKKHFDLLGTIDKGLKNALSHITKNDKDFKKQVSDDKKGEIESTLDDNPGFIELLKIAAIIGAVKLASHKDKKKSLRNLGHDIVWVARDKIYGTCDSIKSTVDKLLVTADSWDGKFSKKLSAVLHKILGWISNLPSSFTIPDEAVDSDEFKGITDAKKFATLINASNKSGNISSLDFAHGYNINTDMNAIIDMVLDAIKRDTTFKEADKMVALTRRYARLDIFSRGFEANSNDRDVNEHINGKGIPDEFAINKAMYLLKCNFCKKRYNQVKHLYQRVAENDGKFAEDPTKNKDTDESKS
mgnify:CR=1 FL=1|jgi:hypothetical protein